MTVGPMQKTIETKLRQAFSPEVLTVINESSSHSVPPGSETHFRVELVTSLFDSLSRIARNRKVYEVLAQELNEGVHALSLKLYTPREWQSQGEKALGESPACHGGSKKD